jgi:hypothetical protein
MRERSGSETYRDYSLKTIGNTRNLGSRPIAAQKNMCYYLCLITGDYPFIVKRPAIKHFM